MEERSDEARRFRDQIVELETKVAEVEDNRGQMETKLRDSNKERDAALSLQLELEAKLGSVSDERKVLLERCLTAENELDRSRNSVIELRRKLDDSQAALHELGRENQAIQVS